MAINNNPFVPLILQGVHMLADDARQQRNFNRQRQFEQEQTAERRRIEQQRIDERNRIQAEREEKRALSRAINDKIQFFGEQSRNPALTPETRQQFSELGFKMLQDPNVDTSGLRIRAVEKQVRDQKTRRNTELSQVEKKIRVVEDEIGNLEDKFGTVQSKDQGKHSTLSNQLTELRRKRADLLGIDIDDKPGQAGKRIRKEEVKDFMRDLGFPLPGDEVIEKPANQEAIQFLMNQNPPLPVTKRNIDFYNEQVKNAANRP